MTAMITLAKFQLSFQAPVAEGTGLDEIALVTLKGFEFVQSRGADGVNSMELTAGEVVAQAVVVAGPSRRLFTMLWPRAGVHACVLLLPLDICGCATVCIGVSRERDCAEPWCCKCGAYPLGWPAKAVRPAVHVIL